MDLIVKESKEFLKYVVIGVIIFGSLHFGYGFDFNVSLLSAMIGMMSARIFDEIEEIKKRLKVIEIKE